MPHKKKYKFALVGHSHELARAVAAGVDPSKEELVCKVVKMGEAISVAQTLFKQGIEAIFGHMGNSRLMLQATGRPIINIPRTRLDMIIAFKKAKEFGKVIGLSSFSEPTDGIEIIEELLNIRIHLMVFNSVDELKTKVYEAFNQGIRVLIGGGISTTIMENLGGKGILSLPRKHIIEQAFDQARMIASIHRKDLEHHERLKTILQMVDEGIIGTDQYGRLNLFNKAAEEILGLEKNQMLDQAYNKILTETKLIKTLADGHSEKDMVCKINGVNVVVNTVPIKINARPRGAITLFRGAHRIENINRKVKETLYTKGFSTKYCVKDIIGQTQEIQQTIKKATLYAPTDGNILIQGETGTGKEMFAQSVHQISSRKNQPFVAINCGAIPDALIESELFGHEEGAFTGAKKGGKIGLIELADKGTVFLDEIADISHDLQVRLLRVIENKEVMRVGGDRYVGIDIRIISSTYKDLRKEVQNNNFRPDLYYRLATLKLNIPPLRERLSDLPLIVKPLIKKFDRKSDAIGQNMIKRLLTYNWPGNVRELASFIESYFILLGKERYDQKIFMSLWEDLIGIENVGSVKNLQSQDIAPVPHHSANSSLKKSVKEFEKKEIKRTLEFCHFSKTQTAKRLGISVNTLWRKLRDDKKQSD